jgi:hypothetical protein
VKPWQSQIPQTPKQRDRKRCYTYWLHLSNYAVAGGKVVWLTDREKTLAYLKYNRIDLQEVTERDLLEQYKKYMHQTIE